MIKVEGLTKLYKGNRGIKGLTFQVAKGEVFGFLGPNGAGKTTTIRHLMGFIQPQSGNAVINSLDCWKDAAHIKKIVGYLPGEIIFIDNMSGIDFLELMAGMHSAGPEVKRFRDELAKRLEIKLEQPIRKMSKGMKQKIGIIYAFMLNSEVLILDEPTTGLDPLMQKVFIDLILEEKEKGKTIFISSHRFQEVERTCDRVGIIKEGELVTVEGIHNLRQAQHRTFEVEVTTEEDVQLFAESKVQILSRKGNRLIILVHGDLNFLFKILAQANIKDFVPKATELEELFLHLYEKKDGLT